MKKSWKTTWLAIAAAAAGVVAADESPASKQVKSAAQVAAWVLVAATGNAAKDHQAEQ